MVEAIIDKNGDVNIYEYKPDRKDCICHYDIIVVPETFINPKILEKLKQSKEPLRI